ncbi:hypothetical protein [Serratia sp. DD3]|uniref:hypothetical protein n=1 Tax=Serratia sp. DD3 TaxID=1410619 RepID=UPI0004D42F4F|nr:hypothetical protein [Serratia sp. DD3]KEY59866.1 hypothetical protein SRDD_12050 [Serratia sp. DD3]KEY60198.1 hypothetical protein SRDD_08270 [Serratia sp. DD3]
MTFSEMRGRAKVGFLEYKKEFLFNENAANRIDVLKRVAATFNHMTLSKVMFSLKEKCVAMNFAKMVRSIESMAFCVANEMYRTYKDKSLDKLIELNTKLTEDVFPKNKMAWLKKDKEACYYLWVLIINIKWKDILSSKPVDLYNSYNYKVGDGNEMAAIDLLGVRDFSPDHLNRYFSLVRFFEKLPFPSEIGINYLDSIFEDYKNTKEECRHKINIKNLTKSDELIVFSLDYLRKKGTVKRNGLMPITHHDNRPALITHIYLECLENADFPGRMNLLLKAWSQHKARKAPKKTVKKAQNHTLPVLSESDAKLLREIAMKFDVNEEGILSEAIGFYYDQMMKF